MESNLNKVALITGGSRGIGASIVRRLAKDGIAVAFTYANSSKRAEELVNEIQRSGGTAFAIHANAENVNATKEAVEKTIEEFGRINILINNAGIFEQKMYDQFTVEEFDRMVAVNVRSVFEGVQAAAPQMSEGDRIITIGSVNADVTGFPGLSLYAMTKAAVAGMTRGLARDLSPKGITVNNIQPGPVDTDMNPADGSNAVLLKEIIAIGRYGKATEIADLVAFLASEQAGYITGASIDINGGFMI
ncbi:3-oxoacyl-ACP reductase family protein [Neobacillus bataviensis]|uniref:3-oxoacyl-ACP reductase family protein n=1 Tax=Neobacillus bataviensis TaxID=220685 RepID=UPI001CBC6CA4|nr:3-oxoacyl-ACP reductase family protein [Neobacillus bataviensis]